MRNAGMNLIFVPKRGDGRVNRRQRVFAQQKLDTRRLSQ